MRTYKTPFITLLIAAAAWFWAGTAHAQAAAQNSIEALNVASQGGRVILRITTKQPLTAAPASFTVNQPARIAFDFPSTANALGRHSQEINEGELRSRTRFAATNCSVAQALEVLGDWWTLLIVREALLGTRRFVDFQRHLVVARNVLSERLGAPGAERGTGEGRGG